jgi:hypothetical protein
MNADVVFPGNRMTVSKPLVLNECKLCEMGVMAKPICKRNPYLKFQFQLVNVNFPEALGKHTKKQGTFLACAVIWVRCVYNLLAYEIVGCPSGPVMSWKSWLSEPVCAPLVR